MFEDIFDNLLGTLVLICIIACTLSGCQAMTREYGGTSRVELEPNVKLEEITWKDDSLWYLTRPMRDDEEPETHIFKESSNFGAWEGTVVIVESRR